MDKFKISEGSRLKLSKYDPDETGKFGGENGRAECEAKTAKLLEKMAKLQNLLFASKSHALLIIVQAMDGSGKDSTISNVMQSVSPQGVQTTYYKAPTSLELSHDYLWRIHNACPPKGMIGIFNRSHYEDVLITRVHGWVDKKTAKKRFEHIRNFEQMLSDSGTKILKFYLNISLEEQRKQLQERVDDPSKRWKFNPGDLEERKRWPDYMSAYEDAISATSTDESPWYVVPGNERWYRNYVIVNAIVGALEAMKLSFPAGDKTVNWDTLKIV
jgi:PPK2 family polyphosphate:nucleotide phosphotransferase